ncbi:MAG: signal peptide peptidase SppA [Ignavibacteria bacterium]|nr:signal peptide peptidase SppA [Ignavibacteria bacterium]
MDQEIIDSQRDETDFLTSLLQDETGKKNSLQEYLNAINTAAGDDNIKAIYLELSDPNSNLTNLQEIWDALAEFKKTGKKIFAYSDAYSARGLYMASVADKIWLNPQGSVLFKGLGMEIPMFGPLLNALGVEAQVTKVGKYKSAVEPYTLQKATEENRTQLKAWAGGLWNSYLQKISAKTKLDNTRLNQIADSLTSFDPKAAMNYGLVDTLIYRHEIKDKIRDELNQNDDPNYISFSDYLTTGAGQFKYVNSDEVRIIYAEGTIISGESTDTEIGSDTFVEAVKDATEDESVKAVVLRVNSPGGDALASDIMYRQLQLLKAKKPLIISMGNYAASGGYYISAPGTVVVASPNTITGSIGVYGLHFNLKNLMNNKLGIFFDTVKTNKYSDFMSSSRQLSPYELEVLQKSVDRVYDTFTGLVATDRKLSLEKVEEIAQGRIWFAPDALQNGLVDTLGGLRDAIKIAAESAGLYKYSVTYTSTSESFFKKLFRSMNVKTRGILYQSKVSDKLQPFLQEIDRAEKLNGVLMLMPYKPVFF